MKANVETLYNLASKSVTLRACACLHKFLGGVHPVSSWPRGLSGYLLKPENINIPT